MQNFAYADNMGLIARTKGVLIELFKNLTLISGSPYEWR